MNSQLPLFYAPIFHVPGMCITIISIVIFGTTIDKVTRPIQQEEYGSHDHELQHELIAMFIYTPICFIFYILFAIWPTLFDTLFGWPRILATLLV